MVSKTRRVRVGTWFEESSSTLHNLDAFCKEYGMQRGTAIRHIVIEWLKDPNHAGLQSKETKRVRDIVISEITDEELDRVFNS